MRWVLMRFVILAAVLAGEARALVILNRTGCWEPQTLSTSHSVSLTSAPIGTIPNHASTVSSIVSSR
jgi:hypothetical protein